MRLEIRKIESTHALTFLAEIVVGRKSDKSFEFLFSLSGPYT